MNIFLKFLLGLLLETILASLCVFAFYTGHWLLGIFTLLVIYYQIFAYKGAATGASLVFVITAIYYGFLEGKWLLLLMYLLFIVGCFFAYSSKSSNGGRHFLKMYKEH